MAVGSGAPQWLVLRCRLAIDHLVLCESASSDAFFVQATVIHLLPRLKFSHLARRQKPRSHGTSQLNNTLHTATRTLQRVFPHLYPPIGSIPSLLHPRIGVKMATNRVAYDFLQTTMARQHVTIGYDLYGLLEVSPNANQAAIREAYEKIVENAQNNIPSNVVSQMASISLAALSSACPPTLAALPHTERSVLTRKPPRSTSPTAFSTILPSVPSTIATGSSTSTSTSTLTPTSLPPPPLRMPRRRETSRSRCTP